MAKKRIASILMCMFFTTPLVEIDKMQIPSEPKEQVAESDRNLNLRNYKIEQVEELVKAEIQKRKEIELAKQERQKEIKKREELEQKKIEESKRQYWKFEVSYYCGCYECTQNGNLLTASGEYAQEGVTIALPQDIPFGSKVHIEGVGDYIVQDRGGFIEYTYDEEGNLVMRVDIFVMDHNRALEYGRYYAEGYIDIKE